MLLPLRRTTYFLNTITRWQHDHNWNLFWEESILLPGWLIFNEIEICYHSQEIKWVWKLLATCKKLALKGNVCRKLLANRWQARSRLQALVYQCSYSIDVLYVMFRSIWNKENKNSKRWDYCFCQQAGYFKYTLLIVNTWHMSHTWTIVQKCQWKRYTLWFFLFSFLQKKAWSKS